jgi:hypothetical protein
MIDTEAIEKAAHQIHQHWMTGRRWRGIDAVPLLKAANDLAPPPPHLVR